MCIRDSVKLCHGNFGPENIVVTDDNKVYRVDWIGASAGNASADVAKTYPVSYTHLMFAGFIYAPYMTFEASSEGGQAGMLGGMIVSDYTMKETSNTYMCTICLLYTSVNKAHAQVRICYTPVTINAEYGYYYPIHNAKYVTICMCWKKMLAMCRKKK